MKFGTVHLMLLALVDVAASIDGGAAAVDGGCHHAVRRTTHTLPNSNCNNEAIIDGSIIIGRRRRRRNSASSSHHDHDTVNTNIILHPIDVLRGGGDGAVAAKENTTHDAISIQQMKKQTLNTLHQTSFLMVASTSMVVFSPLPSLTRHLAESSSLSSSYSPQARAIQILSLLSAISASVELFLSPLVGVLIDNLGRKTPSVILNGLILASNLGVVCHPGVWTICISRMVNVLVGGFLTIVANAVIADVFSTASSPDENDDGNTNKSEMMGSTLGRHAACISLGFLFGSMAGGRLTEYGERTAYGASLLFSVLAMLNVSFRMLDSLQFTRGDINASSSSRTVMTSTGDDVNKPWDVVASASGGLGNKVLEAPLSSVQLLFHYGSHMRILSILLCLQSVPVYMGDVFQVFAKDYWGLRPKEFANIVGKCVMSFQIAFQKSCVYSHTHTSPMFVLLTIICTYERRKLFLASLE